MAQTIGVKTHIVYNHLPRLTAQIRPFASLALEKAARDIEAEWKASMEGPKHGRIYPRPGGKTHQASAPGEAPAIDTGTYANSIQVQKLGHLSYMVFTNVEYAPELEFEKDRPAALPAAEKVWPSIQRALRGII